MSDQSTVRHGDAPESGGYWQPDLFDGEDTWVQVDVAARKRGMRLRVSRNPRRPQNPYLQLELLTDDELAHFDLPHC
jgi:hypothetical protein